MNEIFRLVLMLIALFAAAKILTAIKPVKVALIKRAVAWAEKRYAEEEKSGAKKKCFALKVLRFLLVSINDGTSWLIDAIVAVANDKQSEMSTALKSVTAAEVDAKLAKLKNREEQS